VAAVVVTMLLQALMRVVLALLVKVTQEVLPEVEILLLVLEAVVLELLVLMVC
jgi:hypothetical protein